MSCTPSWARPGRVLQEWADSRISDLIKKACESDKPFAEEVRSLREEVKRLRADKEALEARCQEVRGHNQGVHARLQPLPCSLGQSAARNNSNCLITVLCVAWARAVLSNGLWVMHGVFSRLSSQVEGALGGLKESVYAKDGARRQAEQQLATLEAEVRGASLREAELHRELQEVQTQVSAGEPGCGAPRADQCGVWWGVALEGSGEICNTLQCGIEGSML